MRRLVLIAALPLALAACQAQSPADPPADAPAADTAAPDARAPEGAAPELPAYHWRLTDARDAGGQRLDALFVEDGKPLTVDFVDGHLGLSGGCNRGSAAYAVEGDTLRVQPFASTQMACADARLMALDAAAAEALQGSAEIRWEPAAGERPPQLTLAGAQGTLVFAGEPTVETRYGGPGETVFFEVAPERVACQHPLIRDHRCLQVREVRYDGQGLRVGEPGEWQPLYEEIEGYTHEPGVRNVLRLKRFERTDAPADASSVVYVLDMTVESELVR